MGEGEGGKASYGCRSSIWNSFETNFITHDPEVIDFDIKYPTFVSKVCFDQNYNENNGGERRYFRRIGR